MFKRLVLVMTVATSSAALAGCGNSAGLIPVSGKVLYRGEPAAGAVVYFHRQGPSAASPHPIPTGIAQDDGTFSLNCDGVGDGCPPGKYAVLVEWKGQAGPLRPPQPKPSGAKGKGKTKEFYGQQADGSARELINLKGRYSPTSPSRCCMPKSHPKANTLPPFGTLGD